MERRKIYLQRVSIQDALDRLFKIVEGNFPLEEEEISAKEAVGRVTAKSHFAAVSAPNFNAAAVDGIAVRAEETYQAREGCPVCLRLGEQAVWVNTGNPLPEGYNAVIMVENIHDRGDGWIEIQEAVPPYHHVRPAGEDFVSTELLITENQWLRPVDLAPLIAGGYSKVWVRRKPKVAIIPTGDELVTEREELVCGKIIEHNAVVLGNLVNQWGGEWSQYPIIPDDFEHLKEIVEQAVRENDIVVVNAGSSAGSKDFTVRVVEELGKVFVHGVKIKPGKPVIVGEIAGKPVLGLPGYPVAAVITAEIFLKPLIYKAVGVTPPSPQKIKGIMSRKLVSNIGEEEFVLVKLGKVGEKIVVTPLSRGSGVTLSLSRADGLLRVKSESQGIEAGTEVEVELNRDPKEIENTVVVIGSHDLCLDILGSELKRRYPQYTLSSAHVGSMGGFIALKKGEAHMAGVHLLDEKSGDYNRTYAQSFLPQGYRLINLVLRQQGLIVKKGNPLGIKGIKDIAQKDVRFINRQKGAGTRQLFDYYLSKEGLSSTEIIGYEREAYTHLAVASAVLNDTADVGLGVKAAADALNLEFIPLVYERYDLVIPKEHMDSILIQRVYEVICSQEFKNRILAMGGYDVKLTGEVIEERR